MKDKRSTDTERRVQSKSQNQRRSQNKHKKKESKAPIIVCLILGITIGWVTEFDIKEFIDNISKYKIAIVKEDDEQHFNNSESNSNEDGSNKDQESDLEEVTNNEAVKNETSSVEQETQQIKQEQQKETKEDMINKAKQAIINNCGSEWNGVVYAAESAHPTQGGNYYIFNIGEDITGDMQFYVDTNTYKVYEYSVDGYFGEYRDGSSDVFTYDMAIVSLENYLGWDEDRVFGLVEERQDGFIIRTAFETEGGSGTGETFYVTRDTIDVYTGY